MEKIKDSKGKRIDKALKKFWEADEKKDKETQYQVASELGVHHGFFLQNITPVEVFGANMLSEIRQSMIEEYSLKTQAELMLVDMMITSYHRSLRLESTINTILYEKSGKFSINEDKMKIFNDMYKAIEKANNQYIRALMTLKALKQPAPKINVNAKQAIVGNRQIFKKK